MSLSSLNSIRQTIFELESGNENVDGQTDGQTNGQKRGQTDGITPIWLHTTRLIKFCLKIGIFQFKKP